MGISVDVVGGSRKRLLQQGARMELVARTAVGGLGRVSYSASWQVIAVG